MTTGIAVRRIDIHGDALCPGRNCGDCRESRREVAKVSLLSVQNVTMRFGGVVAVSNIALDIGKSSLLGFIDLNGAGKTTLMRTISGVLRPQDGRIHFDDHDITKWPVDRRIRGGLALAQQIVKPMRSLSLIENVALAASVSHGAAP